VDRAGRAEGQGEGVEDHMIRVPPSFGVKPVFGLYQIFNSS
jgi:hypothetical protein